MNEQKKYEQEDLDYRVNNYTVKCLFIMVLLLVGIWILGAVHIFIVNLRLMTIGLFGASALVLLVLALLKCVDLHRHWVKYVLLTSAVLAFTILEVTLTYHVILLSVFPLLLATQYSNKRVIVFTYIITIISVFVGVMGGYYYGLCDANMLLLTKETTGFYLTQYASGIPFVPSDANPWTTLPIFYALPRCMILLLMMPVIQSISGNLMHFAEYAVRMKQKSETDDLTGLYNRNKYLQMKEEYLSSEHIGVIFWDVNDLKKTNDTLGHAQGDYLITMTAQLIRNMRAVNRMAYRIGGDEFVMVITGPMRGEMDDLMAEWQQMEQVCASASKIPYSVAVGMAEGAGKDFDKIAKDADEQMYRNKMDRKRMVQSGMGE